MDLFIPLLKLSYTHHIIVFSQFIQFHCLYNSFLKLLYYCKNCYTLTFFLFLWFLHKFSLIINSRHYFLQHYYGCFQLVENMSSTVWLLFKFIVFNFPLFSQGHSLLFRLLCEFPWHFFFLLIFLQFWQA